MTLRLVVTWKPWRSFDNWSSNFMTWRTRRPTNSTCRSLRQLNGGFHQWVYPKMDGLEWKILVTWMIEGYPHFRKPPNGVHQRIMTILTLPSFLVTLESWLRFSLTSVCWWVKTHNNHLFHLFCWHKTKLRIELDVTYERKQTLVWPLDCACGL